MIFYLYYKHEEYQTVTVKYLFLENQLEETRL